MKRILVLLIMLFAIFGITSCGELYGDEECLIVHVMSDEDKTCYVTCDENARIKATYLTIPEEIDGYTVIGALVHDSEFPQVRTIEIPNTLIFFECTVEYLMALKYGGTLDDFFNHFTDNEEEYKRFLIEAFNYNNYYLETHGYHYYMFGTNGAKFYVRENYQYKEVTDLVVPETVKELSFGLFAFCSSLRSVTILGDTYLDNKCFRRCDNLQNVYFPKSIMLIGSEVFAECKKLTQVTFNGKKAECAKLTTNSEWRHYSNIRKIICTDGVIEFND